MAVSRAPRSPQKAMAILLGLVLVFSLLLIAVSRESDLHVVHDRTGGHFEHDHHRVFDASRDVSSVLGGAKDGDRARAHPGHLPRGAFAHGEFSSHRLHGATVGGSESATFREARAGGVGGAVGGDGSSVRSRAGFELARGGDLVGDADDLVRPVPGASSRAGGRVSDEDDDASDAFVVPAKAHKSGASLWAHEVWDETKHLTREVEKFAGLAGSAERKKDAEVAEREVADARRVDVDETSTSDALERASLRLSSASTAYVASGDDPNNDDLDFENELRMRPREVDDEAEDADVEAADDAQQAQFDAEALESAAPKKKGWW